MWEDNPPAAPLPQIYSIYRPPLYGHWVKEPTHPHVGKCDAILIPTYRSNGFDRLNI